VLPAGSWHDSYVGEQRRRARRHEVRDVELGAVTAGREVVGPRRVDECLPRPVRVERTAPVVRLDEGQPDGGVARATPTASEASSARATAISALVLIVWLPSYIDE
jgi:hypothetical protein